MATALFESVIFGPIKSRRLGVSLGVNLPPSSSKICNFDCIYCECGWNPTPGKSPAPRFADREVVVEQLEAKLSQMSSDGEHLDVITFAGNGEPTMHPDFPAIIDDVRRLRDVYYPDSKIAVLSNATMIGRESVRRALAKVDRAMLKIDSALIHTIELVNQPRFNYSLEKIIEGIKLFEGEVIIQTMFLKGVYNGEAIDNTSSEELSRWLDVIRDISPKLVMIYSLDRDTPAENLIKVESDELALIAEKVEALGVECSYTR